MGTWLLRAMKKLIFLTGTSCTSDSAQSVSHISSTNESRLTARKYRRNLVLINKAEARVLVERVVEPIRPPYHHHTRFVQIGVLLVRLPAALRADEQLVQFVTIEIVAPVNRHRIVWHVPHQKSAPVQRVVQRPRHRIFPQEIHCLHREAATDGLIES